MSALGSTRPRLRVGDMERAVMQSPQLERPPTAGLSGRGAGDIRIADARLSDTLPEERTAETPGRRRLNRFGRARAKPARNPLPLPLLPSTEPTAFDQSDLLSL